MNPAPPRPVQDLGISPAFSRAIFVRIGPIISKKMLVAVIVVMTVTPMYTAF